MLKQLRIQNVILVEQAEIVFEGGLNVLSGETGSGKSAIMQALALILGERADVGVIRRGCEKAVIEAVFDIRKIPYLTSALAEAGIDHDSSEYLLVRRDILSSGKSRSFINNQLAQLTLLRQMSPHLVKFISQHANHQLFSIEAHRFYVDQFGGNQDVVQEYSKAWQKENALRNELHSLISQEAKRLRDIEVCRIEIEEIEEAALKEGEEEELFAEYSRLTHSEELFQGAQEILQGLNGEKQSVLFILNRQKALFDRLLRIDPDLQDLGAMFHNSFLELQEISHSLQNYVSGRESDPDRLEVINERLQLISKLKKKYGPNFCDISEYLIKARERLDCLENADFLIEKLKEELQIAENQTQILAQSLTLKRQQSASILEKQIAAHLRSLNMPKVEFSISITSQKRSENGDDRVEFFMAPNVGEHLIPIKDCASGGELSRLVLALHVLVAGKENTPTLLFDEVDANIGGETAAAVGEKLNEIGQLHQVICITHFPQVAIKAHHHHQIFKKEIEGRTITGIRLLTHENRHEELDRMLGGAKTK